MARCWNRGIAAPYLDTGTLLCVVGDPARLEGILVVDQADVKFVRRDRSSV